MIAIKKYIILNNMKYSIKKTQGKLENLHINMVGDLKYGRTVHSLLQAMSHFSPNFTFTAPEELKMPAECWLRPAATG